MKNLSTTPMEVDLITCVGCGNTVVVDRQLGVTISCEPFYTSSPGRVTISERGTVVHQCEEGTYGH